jgi:hypothetical protein
MRIFRATTPFVVLGLIAPLVAIGVGTPAHAATANQSVSWTNTSITNGGTTSLVYVMDGQPAFVASFYDGVFAGCFSHNSSNQTLPVTYDQVRTTTSYATTWWIGMFEGDCRTGPAPAMADAYSSSELTMTPSGPYGPDTITALETTETSITLEWPADDYAEGYRVYQDGELIAMLTAADLEYTATGLATGTSYEFTVVGYNYDFEGEGTSVTLKTTSPDLPATGMNLWASSLAGAGAITVLLIGTVLVRLRRNRA